MSREIKFRGQRVDSNEWVEGTVEFHLVDGDLSQSKCYAYITYDSMDKIGKVYRFRWEVIPETVGQYTGLLDANGVKIYEGDIVEAWFPGMPNELRCKQLIMFIDGCFGCGDYPLKLVDKITLKVIGNICKNPDFLKEAIK